MERESSFAKNVKEFVKFLVIASAIALPVRYFVAQPFIVRGESMLPNFEDREYLIIDELSYFFREPERGEVVVFRYPLDPRQYFIKRIIALPGERVEVRNGKVSVYKDGTKVANVLEEPYLAENTRTEGDLSLLLGPGDYFVLGDNRPQSSDGRIWGAMPRRLIVGRAFFRAWPIQKMGFTYEAISR